MNVRDLLRQSAQFYANEPAIITDDIRLTFAEAWERGLRMANALYSLGLKPGDRCGSLEDNNLPAIDFFLGAAIANIVRVPLYARNARSSHAYMLDHTDCKAVIVDSIYESSIEGLNSEIESLETMFTRGSTEEYESWLAQFPAQDPDVDIKADDLYVIRHTGGTTGKPKGVPFTHQLWLLTGAFWIYSLPSPAVGDVCMHIAPISHASGYSFIPYWINGGCNLLVSKYEPNAVANMMEEEKVSFVFMAPTMVNDIMATPGASERDWSNLKVLLIGASPITEANAKRAYKMFGDAICSLYGQSEVGAVTLCPARDWIRTDIEGSNPIRSVGKVHPLCLVKIRDPDTHEEKSPGEEGEICVKFDTQMPGYWKNEEATKNTIINGWVHTGDVGYLDKNGYLYMCDRKDDMILSGGYNIWPAELENAISMLEDVQEVVVIGIPNERFGESPHAIVMEKKAGTVTKEQVVQAVIDECGSYKKPGSVEISTNPIPRTPVGKLSRKLIREPYWEGTGRRK